MSDFVKVPSTRLTKLCPHCGPKDGPSTTKPPFVRQIASSVQVWCPACDLSGPSFNVHEVDEAVAAWNSLPRMKSFFKNTGALKVYLATSWKNPFYESLLNFLRNVHFDVYDFKNPEPGSNGFNWRSLSKEPTPWTLEHCREVLRDPVAHDNFRMDYMALRDAEAVVLLLPSGVDSHMEAAWCAGRGVPVLVYAEPGVKVDPSLMWKLLGPTNITLVTTVEQLVSTLREWEEEETQL